MTQEQNKDWQEAVQPLVERFTGEKWEAEKALLTLLPDEARFTRINQLCRSGKLVTMGVPRPMWVLRIVFLTWSYDYDLFSEPWFPQFALRSATSLLGIAMAHPEEEARQAIFQRIHIRFVRESLLPFVEWLGQMPSSDARKDSYTALMDFYEFCADFHYPADPEEWRKFKSRLRMLDNEPILESERGRCLSMVGSLLESTLFQLGMEHMLSDTERMYWRPNFVPYSLHQQHQWRLAGRGSDEFYSGPNCSHLIIAPFLAALEAECPPLDWLSRG